MACISVAALLIALAIDHRFGEPRRWHPVVGMGRYLGLWKALLLRQRPAAALLLGAAAWCLGAAMVAGIAIAFEELLWRGLQTAPWWLAGPVAAVLLGLALKPLLAWRMLVDEVVRVEQAQSVSIGAARDRLSRLVSRDTGALGETDVREAALESLAENLNDSVVAPLFWYAVAGLPGAAVYRFANTADAMWGYRGRWEWAGKWAARADDVLGWLPARLTAVALLIGQPRATWRGLASEAERTPSPNSGWPMAAAALALGVRFSKPGAYRLNAPGRAVNAGDTPKAVDLCRAAVRRAAVLLALAAFATAFVRSGA